MVKARVASQNGSSKSDRILLNERKLQSNPSDLNPIVDLLEIFTSSLPNKPKQTFTAAQTLHRVFANLIQQGRLHGKLKTQTGQDEKSGKAVREWLKQRYSEYADQLVLLLRANDEILPRMALDILMELFRAEAEVLSSLQNPPCFQLPAAIWHKIVGGLLEQEAALSASLQAHLLEKYINHYDDIRLFFLRQAASLLSSPSSEAATVENILAVLEDITSMPSQPDHLNRFYAASEDLLPRPTTTARPVKKRKIAKDGSTGIFDNTSDEDEEGQPKTSSSKSKLPELLSIHAHKKAFQTCWTALLPKLDTEDQLKRVLAILHSGIIPHLTAPQMLLDFLSDCCNHGGTIALLALNSLFTLMTKHNLDYPSFYHRLYLLLDEQLLHVRYRSRFFRMMELFLSSSHLPVNLVASFIKRLSRLSLSAPPAGVISIIPITYNLMKRHPQCILLIHRVSTEEDSKSVTEDPFDMQEEDPLKTNAIDSSIWELVSMRQHYLASVSTLARIFQEQMTKPGYELNDFLDHTYSSVSSIIFRSLVRGPALKRSMQLFETEMQRKLLKDPALDLPPVAAKKVPFFPPASAVQSDAVWSDPVTELFSF